MRKYKTNAIYVKELKQSVRSIKFPITLGLYCFILGVIGLFTLVAISVSGYSEYSTYNIKKDFMVLYSILFGLEFGLALFAVPALTGGSISGERDHGTLDMLLATSIGTKRIILGKLLSAVTKIMFYVFSSLPILSLIFIIGGTGFYDMLKYIFLIIVTALYIGSFGILMSSIFKKTSTGIAVTYIWVMFITIGTIFIDFISNAFSSTERFSLNFIFIFNPAMTMISLLESQIGLPDIVGTYMSFKKGSSFVMKHWFIISIAAQTAAAAINIMLADYILNPFSKAKRR